MPDRDGNLQDVLLGYDNVTGYENNTCYFGAVIGRNGNRIADAKVTVNGTVYEEDFKSYIDAVVQGTFENADEWVDGLPLYYFE